MNYAYIEKNIVQKIIPEYDDNFPNVPISARFPSNLIAKFVEIPQGTEVKEGYIYENGVFREPDAPPIAYNLAEAIVYKADEINTICEQTIIKGTDYNGEHYSLTEYDQIAISAVFGLAQNPTMKDRLSYHADGKECRPYTAEEVIGLYTATFSFIDYNKTYTNLIKFDIAEMRTIEEVEQVFYGYPLSAKRQKLFDELMSRWKG